MNAIDKLTNLKARRDELDVEIALIERGIERAAYEGALLAQLVTVNGARDAAGQPKLTMTQFLAGGE